MPTWLGMSKTVINVANAASATRPAKTDKAARRGCACECCRQQEGERGVRWEEAAKQTRDKCCFNKFVVHDDAADAAMAIRLTRAINYALSRCVQWNVYPETQLDNYKSWCSARTQRQRESAPAAAPPAAASSSSSSHKLPSQPNNNVNGRCGPDQARPVQPSLPACPQAAVCRRRSPSLSLSSTLLSTPLLPSLLGICCSCCAAPCVAAHGPFWASQRVVPLIQRKSQMTKIKYGSNGATTTTTTTKPVATQCMQ